MFISIQDQYKEYLLSKENIIYIDCDKDIEKTTIYLKDEKVIVLEGNYVVDLRIALDIRKYIELKQCDTKKAGHLVHDQQV